MDFDREMELENAGIDAFEFSLMDEDERREALQEAYLDPDDYDLIEYDSSFTVWTDLQNAGFSLSELEYMDEGEKRDKLRDAGLDPDDYDGYPSSTPSCTSYSVPDRVNTDKHIPSVFPETVPLKPKATTEPVMEIESPGDTHESKQPETPIVESVTKTETKEEKKVPRKVYQFCGVRFEDSDKAWYYRTGRLLPELGDYVEVPFGFARDIREAKVISLGDYAEEVVPVPVKEAQYIIRVQTAGESPYRETIKQGTGAASPTEETAEQQKRIRSVYDRIKKEKKQSLLMAYVTLFLVLLTGAVLFFLWKNNTQGAYDTVLITMGIVCAVFLYIMFRLTSAEHNLTRKISKAERRYPWLSDSADPGLKGSSSVDPLPKVIIAVLVIVAGIAVIAVKKEEDNRIKEEVQAVRHAEEMYQLGMQQFSHGQYLAASESLAIAMEKKIGESQAYWYFSTGMNYASSNSYYSAKDRIKSGSASAATSETRHIGEKLLEQVQRDEQKYNEQLKKQQEEERKRYLQSLARSLPYVGMSERYISNTILGAPSSTVRHNREMRNGKSLVANLYDYTRNGYVIFTARCVDGEVYQVFDHRNNPYKQRSGSSNSSGGRKDSGSTRQSDPFHASDYAHPDDFYYDYYDDFWDYEDAEDYWEAHR